MISGYTREELLHEALVRPREARVPFHDTRVIERSGWVQVLTPSFRDGGMNEVAQAVMDEDEADAVIDATLAQYAEHGIRFRWTVGPDSRPLDLPERLAARGMRSERVAVMAGLLEDIEVSGPPEVAIEPVDERNCDEFAAVLAQGWSMAPGPLAAFQRVVLADPHDRHHAFIARVDGRPVGGANYVVFGRSAYFMGAVVLPEWRGRGAYRSLIAARLQHAARRGVELITIQARASTSAPILAQLGFVTLLEIPVFLNR